LVSFIPTILINIVIVPSIQFYIENILVTLTNGKKHHIVLFLFL